ncbi:hypothetical protein V8C42DRAFT_337831 [Trichoderma barbatum]
MHRQSTSCPSCSWWRSIYPTSNAIEVSLPVLGQCGIRLPVSNQNISLLPVEPTDLSDVSGLDLGLAMSTAVIFALNLVSVHAPQGWGNTVTHTVMDAIHIAMQVVLLYPWERNLVWRAGDAVLIFPLTSICACHGHGP